MRSHSQIVRDFGAAGLHRALRARGHVIHPSTPQRWAERNSIPGGFWADFVDIGASTLKELADAARQGAGCGDRQRETDRGAA